MKSIQGLYLLNFNPNGIKTNSSVEQAMSSLQTKQFPVIVTVTFILICA